MLTYLNNNTITETSLKEIEPIFCTSQEDINNTNTNTFKENVYEEDFNYYNNNLLKDDYEEENDLINKSGDFFNIGNNLENKMDYLSKKRHNSDKIIDDIVDNEEDDDDYYNYVECEHLNKRLNNYDDNIYKNFNIYCNRKNKNKEYVGLPLKETDMDDDILFNQLDEEDNMY